MDSSSLIVSILAGALTLGVGFLLFKRQQKPRSLPPDGVVPQTALPEKPHVPLRAEAAHGEPPSKEEEEKSTRTAAVTVGAEVPHEAAPTTAQIHHAEKSSGHANVAQDQAAQHAEKHQEAATTEPAKEPAKELIASSASSSEGTEKVDSVTATQASSTTADTSPVPPPATVAVAAASAAATVEETPKQQDEVTKEIVKEITITKQISSVKLRTEQWSNLKQREQEDAEATRELERNKIREQDRLEAEREKRAETVAAAPAAREPAQEESVVVKEFAAKPRQLPSAQPAVLQKSQSTFTASTFGAAQPAAARALPPRATSFTEKPTVSAFNSAAAKFGGTSGSGSSTSLGGGRATGKDALLVWCQSVTEGYSGVSVTNFSGSWADGLAFCALFHYFFPDKIDFGAMAAEEDPRRRFELAFAVAESAGITSLIDAEDMMLCYPKPDSKSIVLYLSEVYKVLRERS